MKLSKIHILLAEDSPDDVLFFRRALSKCEIEHTIAVVENGQEAIDYFRGVGKFEDRTKYPFPSFCVLDLKMPGVSGLEVLQWLHDHEECAFVPTIVLTSSALPDDIREAYRLRANTYFTTPNSTQELCALLTAIMKYWHLAHVPMPPPDARCS